MASRVYDSSILLESDRVYGLIVRENCQASENPDADVSIGPSRFERQLAPRIVSSLSSEEEPVRTQSGNLHPATPSLQIRFTPWFPIREPVKTCIGKEV